MQSSNASLNDSSYMPMMSNTQQVLQRAKRSQAIRQKIKDEIEENEQKEATGEKPENAAPLTIWDKRIVKHIKTDKR